MTSRTHYRSIWVSDFHLGTRDCKAEFLLDFLRRRDTDYLYLNGDIFDGWALQRSWYWDTHHNDVIEELLKKAHGGTKVIYIPGNHDEFARGFTRLYMGGISIQSEAIHTTADDRRLLVMHGDEFDGVVKHARLLSLLGAWAYQGALRINRWFNYCRRRLGMPYWSLSAYLKQRTKKAAQFIAKFEESVARAAGERDVEGVVCGHIHHAEIRHIGDVLYANAGDWVESCTALVEHASGTLEIVPWMTIDTETHEPVVDQIGGDGALRKSMADDLSLTLQS